MDAPPTKAAQTSEALQASETSTEQPDAQQKLQDRQARFKALQARQTKSKAQNRKATQAEAQRQSVDPSALTAVQRKRAIASQKLLKADTEDAGEDFERKRAWDWTIDESEKWAERMAEKEQNRDNAAFQDYTQQARKAYRRQERDIGDPDLESYEALKAAAVQRAAENGQLELVEQEDGEIIAVDRTGAFTADGNDNYRAGAPPSKEKIDRLVGELKKAEEASLRKKRQRRNQGDETDVTYINEKNKVFNDKLARFYNKYTADIRENFERGTAI